MAKLTFVLEDGQEVVVPLAGLVTLGRDDDNDVVIEDDHISRHHAVLIRHADGRVEVRDLGSTTGTFVNDQPIRGQVIAKGDRLAFGPLQGRIEFDEADAASLADEISAEQERLAELRECIQAAGKEHDEKTAAVQRLNADRSAVLREIENLAAQRAGEQALLDRVSNECTQAEERLSDLRRQLADDEQRGRASKELAEKSEEQVKSVRAKLDQMSREQQLAQEKLDHIETEVVTRQNDLAAETRRFEEASKRCAELLEQCQALAAREAELRLAVESFGPNAEKAREELSGLEARLAPLRDWKKSMDQRYARIGMLEKGSAEENALWHEIEEAHAALFDLLPAARITPAGLTRGDFSRMVTRAGLSMKSDRIRRAGTA